MKNIEYLSKVDGNITDICEAYYHTYLKDNTDKRSAEQAFIDLLIWDFSTDRTLKIAQHRKEEEYIEVINKIKETINIIVDNLTAKNLRENDFYSKLWETIIDGTLFASDIDRICAIICLVRSSKIPYYWLQEGMRMDDEEYVNTTRSLISNIKKAIFILNMNTEQKTEKASRVFDLLEELSDRKEKVVFLSNIINLFEVRIQSLVKETQKFDKK